MEEKKTATLYLIRHGQTAWNAEGRIQGRIDTTLDVTGREQAREAGLELASLKASAIYSSPLMRAKETAEWIAAYQSCPLFFEESLQEGRYGQADGLTHGEYAVKYKSMLDRQKTLPFEEQLAFRVAPDSESAQDILDRALPLLLRIASEHLEKCVLVVTHGYLMGAIIAYLHTESRHSVKIPNTGVIILEGDGKELQVAGFKRGVTDSMIGA